MAGRKSVAVAEVWTGAVDDAGGAGQGDLRLFFFFFFFFFCLTKIYVLLCQRSAMGAVAVTHPDFGITLPIRFESNLLSIRGKIRALVQAFRGYYL